MVTFETIESDSGIPETPIRRRARIRLFQFDDARATLADTFDLTPPKSDSNPRGDSHVQQGVFSPDGTRLALVQGGIGLYDISSMKLRQTHTIFTSMDVKGTIRDQPLYDMMFSPDGYTLAIACAGTPQIRLWDLSGEKPVERRHVRISAQYPVGAWNLAFSPNGNYLAWWEFSGEDLRVMFYDLTRGDILKIWPTRNRCQLTFAPDSRHLLMTERTGVVAIQRLFERR
jgi:WD40 repeat protein